MANEATLYIKQGIAIPIKCSTSAAFEKGQVLKLADPFTASASSALNDVVAGIVSQEKLSTDGKDYVACYRQGIFKMVASGSITCGDAVVVASGGNKVETAAVNAENLLGTALETATNGETFLVELLPRGVNLA